MLSDAQPHADSATARHVIPFRLTSFDVSGREPWQLYRIRLQGALRSAGITDDQSKKDALFAICDTDMFQLMASFCRPKDVDDPEMTFAEILVLFDQYFRVNVSEPQATQAFHRRKQSPGEKSSGVLGRFTEVGCAM